MRVYYVYILECNDKSYYIGVTNDLQRRLIEHEVGVNETSYTYWNRPVKLVYFEEYGYVEDAIIREKQLKGWARRKKECLINSDFERLYGNNSS